MTSCLTSASISATRRGSTLARARISRAASVGITPRRASASHTEDLDLEPDREAMLVGPQTRHLGPGVAAIIDPPPSSRAGVPEPCAPVWSETSCASDPSTMPSPAADELPLRARDARHDELRDPIARPDRARLVAQVDEHELDLAAVVRVDRSRRIEQRDAVAQRESAARPHLRLEARGSAIAKPVGTSARSSGASVERSVESRRQIAAGAPAVM